jgi:hypothetical protein
MTQEQSRQVHAIISYYQSKYNVKFGQRPVVNRNTLQWAVANMLKDLSMKELKEIIDFYIETDKQPSLKTLCYEYDEVIERMRLESKDLERRKALLERTQKSVEEFRRRYGAG